MGKGDTWNTMDNRFSKTAGALPNTMDFLGSFGFELMVKADEVRDTLPPKIHTPHKCFGPDCD